MHRKIHGFKIHEAYDEFNEKHGTKNNNSGRYTHDAQCNMISNIHDLKIASYFAYHSFPLKY